MAVTAEPMPGNAVIPPTTNVTEAFSAPKGEGSDVISNIRGAIDKLEPKLKSKTEAKPQTSILEKTTKLNDEVVAPKIEEAAPIEEKPEATTDEEQQTASEATETPEQKEARHWGKTKKELAQAKKELEELRTKAADLDRYTKEIEDYKERLAETEKEKNQYNEELYMTRVEKTAEYRKFITEPLAKVEQQAEALATRNKLDPATLKKALQEDAKGNTMALDEILADLPDREKQRIYGLSDQLITISDRQADIHENSKLAYEAAVLKEQERLQETTQKAIETRQAVIQKLIPKISSEVIEKMPEDKRPDMDVLSKEVMNVNEWPEELKVYGGIASAVLPYILDDNKAMRSEIEQLKAANAKLRNSSPSPAGGRTPSAPSEVEKPVDYKSMKSDDFIKNMVSRLPTR